MAGGLYLCQYCWSMTLELVPATQDMVATLGEICHRAFLDISQRHGFETDFESPEMAQMVLSSCIRNEDCHAMAAVHDGAFAGSNYLTTMDEVGAVGPISVDPPHQGKAIGRALMQECLAYARDNGIERVRLMQDSFNMQSLALYASLGFDTKAPVALLDPPGVASPEVRPATELDLDAIEGLSREIYGVNRRREVAGHLHGPFRPFVYEHGGRVLGYFIPGMIGHGVAESEDVLVAIVLGAVAETAPMFARAFCPLTEGTLYRRFLEAGCRNRKVMNLMAIGPYEEPRGPWLPSVGF